MKKFSKFVAIGMAGLVSWAMLKQGSDIQTSLPTIESRSDDFIDSKLEIENEERVSTTESTSSSKSEFIQPTGEDVPESQNESIPELVPEPSQEIEQLDIKTDSDSTTGSISLDGTVNPEQFLTASATDPIDPIIFSIVVPIAVIASGIIIERILTKWYNKKKNSK